MTPHDDRVSPGTAVLAILGASALFWVGIIGLAVWFARLVF